MKLSPRLRARCWLPCLPILLFATFATASEPDLSPPQLLASGSRVTAPENIDGRFDDLIRSISSDTPSSAKGTSESGKVPRTGTPTTDKMERLPDQTLRSLDLTVRPDDIWVRIRNGFGMPDLDSPLVASQQAWYLNHPQSLSRALARSRRYLYHIVEEIQKRGMPTELALLPVVESSFNPLARSPARAVGLWQFIPSTGRNYNLRQDQHVDERRDIIASTGAALDYLKNIYTMHGDWFLALASYNWGEGAVGRALAKNRAANLPAEYQSLKMPRETAYYVPKLQAIKNIIARPELFGFELEPIANKPYFDTVDLDDRVDLATAARLADTSIEEFLALNPAYRTPVIPGESQRPLVIPADKVETFRKNLERYEAGDTTLRSWTTYILKMNETLQLVAKRYDVPVEMLLAVNNLKDDSKIHPGQNLLVPNIESLPPELARMFSEPVQKIKQNCKRAAGKGKQHKRARCPSVRSSLTLPAPGKRVTGKRGKRGRAVAVKQTAGKAVGKRKSAQKTTRRTKK